MPFFATPYYLSLLNCTGSGYNDDSLRSYILYSPQLVETYGQIRAWEREDIVEAGKPNAAGWLLPDGHNIHRRYPEVAILIPDTMGEPAADFALPASVCTISKANASTLNLKNCIPKKAGTKNCAAS